jgi:hypothetical protein
MQPRWAQVGWNVNRALPLLSSCRTQDTVPKVSNSPQFCVQRRSRVMFLCGQVNREGAQTCGKFRFCWDTSEAALQLPLSLFYKQPQYLTDREWLLSRAVAFIGNRELENVTSLVAFLTRYPSSGSNDNWTGQQLALFCLSWYDFLSELHICILHKCLAL